jgi:hypothetical protein
MSSISLTSKRRSKSATRRLSIVAQPQQREEIKIKRYSAKSLPKLSLKLRPSLEQRQQIRSSYEQIEAE